MYVYRTTHRFSRCDTPNHDARVRGDGRRVLRVRETLQSNTLPYNNTHIQPYIWPVCPLPLSTISIGYLFSRDSALLLIRLRVFSHPLTVFLCLCNTHTHIRMHRIHFHSLLLFLYSSLYTARVREIAFVCYVGQYYAQRPQCATLSILLAITISFIIVLLNLKAAQTKYVWSFHLLLLVSITTLRIIGTRTPSDAQTTTPYVLASPNTIAKTTCKTAMTAITASSNKKKKKKVTVAQQSE